MTVGPDLSFRMTTSWCGICARESCLRPLPPLKETAETFFTNGSVACAGCGDQVDVWASARALAREDLGGFLGLSGLGASFTGFMFELGINETKEIDFAPYGVPADAVILSVNYTPNGPGCFPIEIHGNEARARKLGTRVSVFGRPFKGESATTPIACSVCWVHEADDSEPWLLIAEAFEAAAARRYARLLVPAYSAVELSLSRLILDVLSRHAPRDRVKRFIVNDLTSSSARSVLLPLLAAQAGVPTLREEIRGCLSRLGTLRNKVAHDGLTDAEVDKSEAGELLCAAVFGFEYVRFLRPRLMPVE